MDKDKKIGTLIKIIPVKRKINAETTYDSLLIFYRDEARNKEN